MKRSFHISSFILVSCLALTSCWNKKKEVVIEKKDTISQISVTRDSVQILAKPVVQEAEDHIVVSKDHQNNTIHADVDGDGLQDTVQIVMNTQNHKSGLRIIYGDSTRKTDYFGLGKDVLNQGFDEISWVGIFEVAPKGEVYYNNVNDEGEIISEEEVKESDKIKLKNDGIFIHAAESCGGGVIYLDNGKFNWIQQE